jgi:hypothetical protein
MKGLVNLDKRDKALMRRDVEFIYTRMTNTRATKYLKLARFSAIAQNPIPSIKVCARFQIKNDSSI